MVASSCLSVSSSCLSLSPLTTFFLPLILGRFSHIFCADHLVLTFSSDPYSACAPPSSPVFSYGPLHIIFVPSVPPHRKLSTVSSFPLFLLSPGAVIVAEDDID